VRSIIEVVYSQDRRAATVFQGLPDMAPERREAWDTWLRRHGLEPTMVVLGTEIHCDDETRRVYYTTFDRKMRKHREEYVQLEAPALPFP
jgi:hypothetical protein